MIRPPKHREGCPGTNDAIKAEPIICRACEWDAAVEEMVEMLERVTSGGGNLIVDQDGNVCPMGEVFRPSICRLEGLSS